MSENMARLSKEHHAAIESAETPVKSSIKSRFTNIFKSSPRSSMENVNEDDKLQSVFMKVGLNPADRVRLSDESPHSPLIMADVKPQELTAPTAMDKFIDATGETDAKKLVNEWQTKIEEKMAEKEEKEEKEEKKEVGEEKEQQTAPIKSSYGYYNTIDEMLELNPNWFSHSHDDEEDEGMIDSWSRRVNDIAPVSNCYSHSGRKIGLDEPQPSPTAEKGMSIMKEDTVDSWDKHIAEISDTSSPRTPTANRYSTVYGGHENVEQPYTVQTFSPIMGEYVTELGETIQDTRNMQTTELDSLAMEGDNTQVDNSFKDDASVDSAHSPSKLLVDTELLKQLYEQGVPTPEGVQFYVNRKITEALLAHEEKLHRKISNCRLEVPKALRAGPVLITDPVLVSYSRKAVRLTYYAIFFCAALAGPETFLVSVWKMAIMFGVYEVVMREFGWKDEQTPDLLFEPLHHGIHELLGKGEDAAMRLGYTLGPFIGGIVRGIVDADDEEEVEE